MAASTKLFIGNKWVDARYARITWRDKGVVCFSVGSWICVVFLDDDGVEHLKNDYYCSSWALHIFAI